MTSVNRPDVTLLEEKTKAWFSKRQRLLNKVSSELQVSANPTFYYKGRGSKKKNLNLILDKTEKGEYVLKFGIKKLPYIVIFALACQSWWYPDELRSSVQFLILEEERIRWNLCHEELDLVLHDKPTCILYLQEQVYTKGWNWLFGTILTCKWSCITHTGESKIFKLEKVLPRFYYQIKKKPQPQQRKRGYRDHGSLGDYNKSIRLEEQRIDYSSRLSEEDYQAKKKKSLDLISFLRGWFS